MTDAVGLVVPLYDEASRFPEFGKLLLDFVSELPPGSELVFVDDGSGDATADLVEELLVAHPGHGCRLLRRPHEGKGAAVAAGLRTVSAPHAAFCDLDLSTPLRQLERVIAAAVRSEVLAVGSRDLSGSRLLHRQTRVRETLGRGYNRLLQATVTPGVVDTQCGAKAASRRVWEAILPRCRERGFAWDAEVVAIAMALGIEVQEVAIEWRHDARSKVRVGRDGLAMVWSVPRIWRRANRAARDREVRRGEVFDADNADRLIGSDRTHWWFRSKAAIVATALRRTARGRPNHGALVDLGAGSGGVSALLGWPLDRVVVVEGNARLAGVARWTHGLTSVCASVKEAPLRSGAADVVCLLDVIEHHADPRPALREAARLLGVDGRVVINVPAHGWLWSAADVELGHHRRYTRRMLRGDLEPVGLQPVLLGHVFSWLVPPVWTVRRLARPARAELGLDRTSVVVDRAALVLTRLERGLIGRVPLPFGTSILCVAERSRTDSRK
jgi:dolichyl-phosphate beta-glucosyltransferase